MATIDQQLGDGGMGRGISAEHGVDNLVALFNAIVDDMQALHDAITGITAKLDAEDVTNLDTDYAALHNPAALTLVKGT